MSEEPTPPETDESIKVPPPRKRAKRKSHRQVEAEYQRRYAADLARAQAQQAYQAKEQATVSPIPQAALLPPVLTLADIQAAKAIIAQAEAALGVAKPKGAIPAPTHPKDLENPAYGDKTPAVVEWYRDNDPQEYRRRYFGRKTHLEDTRSKRPYEPLPGGANVAPFPADPDGKFMVAGREANLSKTDHSGASPRVL